MTRLSLRICLSSVGAVLAALAPLGAFANPTGLNCQDSALSFRPYSSSYQPWSTGPIAENRHGKLSVLEKLDRLNEWVRRQNSDYQHQYESYFRRPGSPDWMGFCNQWSAAALNKSINAFLNATGDINCAGISISGGEIAELFTAFYPGVAASSAGVELLRPYGREDIEFLMDAGGMDKLDAAKFDEILTKALRDDSGAILSIQPSEQVWNQPVFASTRCEEDRERVNFENIPPKFLDSPNQAINGLLKSIAEIDQDSLDNLGGLENYIQNGHDLRDAMLAFDTVQPGYSEEISAMLKTPPRQKGPRSYVFYRDLARRLVKILAEHHLVSLKPDLRIREVSNTVSFATESEFGLGGHLSASKTYVYALLYGASNAAVVGSFWITPYADRPAFIWIPRANDLERLGNPLQALMQISARCKH